ncbi:hypothetical protein H6P81_005287 [Aristolochia fimbriata]|uniref:Uncharacterized protein n=1 Tax=Aristolochia fimbriata TaxID=158543 RepID=A0AAV7EUJ2_ARIFI|nr:hypothetical protein H6P81_005287 [Aristolochia fimbriata]
MNGYGIPENDNIKNLTIIKYDDSNTHSTWKETLRFWGVGTGRHEVTEILYTVLCKFSGGRGWMEPVIMGSGWFFYIQEIPCRGTAGHSDPKGRLSGEGTIGVQHGAQLDQILANFEWTAKLLPGTRPEKRSQT